MKVEVIPYPDGRLLITVSTEEKTAPVVVTSPPVPVPFSKQEPETLPDVSTADRMAGQETPPFRHFLPRPSAPLTPEEESNVKALLARFQDPRDRTPKPVAFVDPPSSSRLVTNPSKKQIGYFYVLARKASIDNPSEWLKAQGLPASPDNCTIGQLSQVIERLVGENRAPFAGRTLRKKPQEAL